MHIDILTLFPEIFQGAFSSSIIKRAQEKKIVSISLHQIRDWAQDKHHLTDDRPFGGGPGMVMKPEPLVHAVEDLKSKWQTPGQVILLTPQGTPCTQSVASQLSTVSNLILICGRYEGVDQRVIDLVVDQEISIGDYILSGGEIPAMALTDAIIRLLPGALGNEESPISESFTQNLLDYPQYTQPAEFRGIAVPEILRSGNHAAIAKWRTSQAEEKTKKVRPDLWDQYLNSKYDQ